MFLHIKSNTSVELILLCKVVTLKIEFTAQHDCITWYGVTMLLHIKSNTSVVLILLYEVVTLKIVFIAQHHPLQQSPAKVLGQYSQKEHHEEISQVKILLEINNQHRGIDTTFVAF